MKKQTKSSALDEHGYPKPKQVECFKCKGNIWLKFSMPRQDYSLKNNWAYWTDNPKNENIWICNSCLRNFYLNEKKTYLATIKNVNKKRALWTYINRNNV